MLAGAGQFGTPDQGIFSYWVNAHLRKRPLRYIGFDGSGRQVRDAFHPRDLAGLLDAQMRTARKGGQRVYMAGGGASNAMSLAQLTAWCDARFGPHSPSTPIRATGHTTFPGWSWTARMPPGISGGGRRLR